MRLTILVLSLLLFGCASTAAKKYVGKPITDAHFELGMPENVIDLSDGRKAFQYRWGSGTIVQPARSSSTINSYRNVATIDTIYTPAQIYENAGCLITLIAKQQSVDEWVVEEWRIPQRAVC